MGIRTQLSLFFAVTLALGTFSCSSQLNESNPGGDTSGGLKTPPPPSPLPSPSPIVELPDPDNVEADACLPSANHHSNPEKWLKIHNVVGGEIVGSLDQGKTWKEIGRVVFASQGEYWRPTVSPSGVLAFNFARGPSTVFASAVNNLHLRFSDPPGYKLPDDYDAELVEPHGFSIAPADTPESPRIIVTNNPGGTGVFGKEWSPKVGALVFMGDDKKYEPIPYDVAPNPNIVERSYILIKSQEDSEDIEYLDFENKVSGKVMLKVAGQEARQVAKVLKPVEGVGRYVGSEFLQQPGQIRANHLGVFDVGTTDINIDPEIQKPLPKDEATINPLRGGFQVVPSHHFQDRSMQSGGDHAQVYLEVGPIIDPPHLKRYDMGIEGTYPLFKSGIRGGVGVTCFKFVGIDKWFELKHAVQLGKFRTKSGEKLKHLRGYVKDALYRVTAIRVINE